MKSTKVLEVLQAIDKWREGETGISSICDLLGDKNNNVGRMLIANGIADFSYKPIEGFSYQAVVDAILLYLAMRQEIDKPAKR